MPMIRKRSLSPFIDADLRSKMVFVAGPRQVGKTTLGLNLLEEWGTGAYLNWDNRGDRKAIRNTEWPGGDHPLVVLDEIHKWRTWKGWLKGEFDKHGNRVHFLVTGSARLDLYRRGGDSLQGRYHHYRLHPFSLAEINRQKLSGWEPGKEISVPGRGDQEVLESLLALGGFPEPFLADSPRKLRRWQKERVDRFLREDVRDLETIRDLASMQLLADLLPERVGSLLSINALRENLEVSHRAVSNWMEILERLYYGYRIRPHAAKKIQSIRQMPKAYLWDWSMVEDRTSRFENLIAGHLLKFCHLLADRDGYRTDLVFLRDRTGKEVDFLVTVNRKPWFCVEAKVAATRIDPAIPYFRDRVDIPWSYQVTLEGNKDFVQDGIRCLPAHRFLAALA